jgi:CheY-like chemotaxis protein
MANRLALVVDDSKTARVTLKRMLEKQNIDADTVDSAQMALDYLVDKAPDVIFMDHMMPGMDGLQAVEAIKSNPETATIPIMMYTSKEGDLYVSQARALGAVGILPKQVEPAELYEVLNKLGLVEDRRSTRAPETNRFVLLNEAPDEIKVPPSSEDMAEIARRAAEAANHTSTSQGHLASLLENYHHEMVQDVRDLRAELDQLTARRRTGGSGGFNLVPPLVVGLLMLIPLLWSISSNNEARSELQAANKQLDQLELARLYQQEEVSSNTSTASALRAQLVEQKQLAADQSELLVDSITWAINQSSPFDIREEAYSDRRLTILQELITRLKALGFTGTVQLHSHLGEFCLIGDAVNGYTLPPSNMPVTECARVGHPLQQLPSLGERQSIAFANFLATSPLLQNSGIEVELVSHQYSRPRAPYPPKHPDITAYEWNRVGAANNRVEISLIPQT